MRGLPGEWLVQFAFGRAFEDPSDLGEQIGPPASSRSSVTAASCSSWASSRKSASKFPDQAMDADRQQSASAVMYR